MKQADKEGHVWFHLYDTSRIETGSRVDVIRGWKEERELLFNEYRFYVEDGKKKSFF